MRKVNNAQSELNLCMWKFNYTVLISVIDENKHVKMYALFFIIIIIIIITIIVIII